MFSSNQSNVAAAAAVNYIEDVFSTYLYTGTSPTLQTITNNIDLSTKGGLVWVKARVTAYDNYLVDSARGNYKRLESNSTGAQFDGSGTSNGVALTTSGFTVSASNSQINLSGEPYASWTFREQAKFFDIVTWTGNGTTQNIPHSLGATPGCIIVKNISSANGWQTWHRGLTSGYRILLNSTSAETNVAIASVFGNNSTYVAPTSTQFTVGNEDAVNQSGQTMVAYLFAHDAGGFGLTGTDNVISCGSFTGNGNNTITLGYEPQFILLRRISSAGNDWELIDNMRGATVSTGSQVLYANSSAAEGVGGTNYPTATGFYSSSYGSGTIIYIAIRRGPMKVPTLGTSVFEPVAYTGNGTNPRTVGTLQVTDLAINMNRPDAGDVPLWVDRLRGPERYLYSSGTAAEAGGLTGWLLGQSGQTINAVRNTSPTTYIDWLFRRAPSFFDEVAGPYFNGNLSHNLGVVPELVIVKQRDGVNTWYVWTTGFTTSQFLRLNTSAAIGTDLLWNTMTSTQIGLQNLLPSNTGVYYLFATCAGVSKVGSYTGNGTTQTIDCGFGAGGARFVLIKRTDATGDWYVYDTARGMTVLTDPYLLFNTTDAEVATLGSVTTVSTGFALNSTILAAINVNAGTYIFLAIA